MGLGFSVYHAGDDPIAFDNGIDYLDKVASYVGAFLLLLCLYSLFDLVLVRSEFKYSIHVE